MQRRAALQLGADVAMLLDDLDETHDAASHWTRRTMQRRTAFQLGADVVVRKGAKNLDLHGVNRLVPLPAGGLGARRGVAQRRSWEPARHWGGVAQRSGWEPVLPCGRTP